MKVLITTSAAPSQTPFSTSEKRAPLGIGFLISVLRDAGHDVFFIDNYLKPNDFLETNYLLSNKINFVAIYANTICFRDTQRMLYRLEWLRQTGRWSGKIIVGGPHTTVCLDTIPQFVDFVVQGEGENAIVDIVENRISKRVVKYPRIKHLDELPMPAWDYFTNMPYDWGGDFFTEKPVFTMNTSRGCPFNCRFCSVKSIWGKRYTFFSAERIVKDIEYLIKNYGAKGIYFREDNFTLNQSRLKKFCNLILERGIKIPWSCESRVNKLDRETIELMSNAGACGFYFGIESGSQKILDYLKKEISVQEIKDTFKICHKHNIKTAASIVLGVPGETKEDVKLTFELLEQIKPTMTWFNAFVGIPASELYEHTLKNKLYDFVDDRGLVYLKGHNQRVKALYGGRWDANIPYYDKDHPQISVIMSVYNGEDHVENAIKSILSQSYSNFEFIIVNDGSTDNTAQILSNSTDPRIRILTNDKTIGLTKCLNRAASIAKGVFIARMDADDISIPHRFETQIAFLEKNQDHALVGTAFYKIDESGKILELVNPKFKNSDIKLHINKQNQFGHGSVMMRQKVFLEMEGYNEKFKYAQDYDLWLRISEKHKFANIPEPLYCWRKTSECISIMKEDEQRHFANMAIIEYRERNLLNKVCDHEKKCSFVGDKNGVHGNTKFNQNGIEGDRSIYRGGQCYSARNTLNSNFENDINLDSHKSNECHKIENPNRQKLQLNDVIKKSHKSIERYSSERKVAERPICSIIIPVFNRIGFTKQCVESIWTSNIKMSYEIIIIDNGSSDGTAEYLDSIKNSVNVIRNSENTGFAKACNQGASNSQGRYLLFLNNDTKVIPGWLDALVKCARKDEKIGVVGAKLLYPDNTIQHAGVGISDSPHPIFAFHLHHKVAKDAPEVNLEQEYQAVTAACMLIEKDLFDTVGGFDEGFVNGYEDVDLCFRVRELGRKVIYCPSSELYHYESMSEGRFSAAMQNVKRLHQKWMGKIVPDKKSSRVSVCSKLTSIIVLTFNQLEYTKKCVDSIFACTQTPIELILVDNGSSDDTVGYLRQVQKEWRRANIRVKVVENKKNLGFAAGNNRGLAQADGDYIVLLNNDVVVTPGWLEKMIACVNRIPLAGIVGPMTNYVAGEQLVPSVGYDPLLLENLNEFSSAFYARHQKETKCVLRVVGFCMLIKRAVIEKIGGLDERYGLGNFEDDDFSLRARLAGFQSWIAGDCFVHHFGSRTFRGEGIAYNETIKKNWQLFKQKWQMPQNLPHGAYNLTHIGKKDLDKQDIYVALENEMGAIAQDDILEAIS